jgi:prepilin-type N-terminal cleavage/methylation domain-containing protein/prepilin-type processing-associated H-X9-DG protein
VSAPRRESDGFTLVELLAVIAIILILVAVLFPFLGSAKRRANIPVCQSNLRQLYLGMIMDLGQRDTFTYREYQIGKLWMTDVAKGLVNIEDVRYCPEAPGTNSSGFARNSRERWRWGPTGERGSYGLNGWIYGPMDSTGAHGGAGLYFGNANWPVGFWGTIGEAGAKAPMFADCNWVDGWPFDDDIVPTDLDTGIISAERPTYLGRFCIARHSNSSKIGINVTFCDGHTAYVPLDMLWDLQWSRTFKRLGQKKPFP